MEDKLIVIANETYTSALALQGYLNSNGIECYLKNVNLIQPNISDNVKVQIREADAERAIKLLVELDDPGGESTTFVAYWYPLIFPNILIMLHYSL